MPQIMLTVNGTAKTVDVELGTPLLWVLRDALGLTGTKFGCGMAYCGACTVHLDAPNPTDRDIDESMSGNLCRCGTYQRIRRAIQRAAELG